MPRCLFFLVTLLVCAAPLDAQQNASAPDSVPPVPDAPTLGTPVDSVRQPIPLLDAPQQSPSKPVEIDPEPIEIPADTPLTEQQLGSPVPRSVSPPNAIPTQALLEPANGGSLPAHTIEAIPDNEVVTSSPRTTAESVLNAAAVFEGPCHFPYHTCGVSSAFMGDNLVIYEGMRVLTADDGSFEVSFIAEVPDVPAVLSLSLRIHEALTGAVLGSITLPPVVMEPQTSYSWHQPSQTVRVSRKGYSHTLRRLQSVDAKPQIVFTRNGSARFGSIPSKGDYSIAASTESETSAQ